MPIRASTIVSAIPVIITTWWVGDAFRLKRTYPLRPLKPNHSTPSLTSAQPPDVDPSTVEAIYTTVPFAVKVEDLEKFIYRNWTVELFGSLLMLVGPPKHGDENSYAAGYFPVIYRDGKAVMVEYDIPRPSGPSQPGLQVVTTEFVEGQVSPRRPKDPDGTELSYANYAFKSPALKEPWGTGFIRRWHMRYLLDRAKGKLEWEQRKEEWKRSKEEKEMEKEAKELAKKAMKSKE